MSVKKWAYWSALFIASCQFSWAQHYKVLHSFSGTPNDASYVISSLVFDRKGNLYGTSANGGNGYGPEGQGNGTVFELSPNGDGTWSESVIYNFCTGFNGVTCLDGDAAWAGVVPDAEGNLYGTTYEGGSGCTAFGCGGGVVFELSPPQQQGGAWTEMVLHNFCSLRNCLDGNTPIGLLIFDGQGNLYGTTAGGGSGHFPRGGGGTVFKLAPGSQGWTESVLYSFCSVGQGKICPDGDAPYLSGVVFDSVGNLYGTTENGGSTKNEGTGVVYKLSPTSKGWHEVVLLAFPAPNMFTGLPSGGLALDPLANIYGTFQLPNGGVYRLNPNTKQKSLFLFDGSDGQQPIGGVTLDVKNGILYGTTAGGSTGGSGIYKIDPSGKETMLYQFCSQPGCVDGDVPWATMIMDKDGNLYGTTEFGGEFNNGVVFEYTP